MRRAKSPAPTIKALLSNNDCIQMPMEEHD
jgi:hypothetical protein